MRRRVLVMSAGTGATNNLVRGLRAGDASWTIVGCHSDPFFLKKSCADANVLLPSPRHPRFAAALRSVVKKAEADLIIPTTDEDVRRLDVLRGDLSCRVFLPQSASIAVCQDKYALIETLRARGVPVAATYAVRDIDEIEQVFDRLKPASRIWCRARRGAGSVAAIPVADAAQARAWISYWDVMRGVPPGDFILSEYLPGRDFACQTLWQAGAAILFKTTERLSYFGGRNTPSGTSSIGGLPKTVNERRVAETSLAAVRAVDSSGSGAFSVDLKEAADGRACVTEINVGRFLTGTPIFDLTGQHNMSATYVRLALGDAVDIAEAYDVAEDYYMIRDLDALPDVFHADALNAGVGDAREMAENPNFRRLTWADHRTSAKTRNRQSPYQDRKRARRRGRRTPTTRSSTISRRPSRS